MLLRLALLLSVPACGQYLHSAAVAIPPYAQLANFPYLVSCNSAVQSCPQFRSVGNGGQVQNSSGFDIAFYADAGCSTTKLNWEIEDWSATTGNGDWWVQIPASTSTFYECWDNASISTDQSSKTATWSGENYNFVMHGGSPSSFSTADSSVANISGTASSVSAGTGIVNGAGSYNGSSSLVDYGTPVSSQCSATCTIEAWINTNSNPTAQQIVSNQWNFCCNGLTIAQQNSFQSHSVTNLIGTWGTSGSSDSAVALFNTANSTWHLVAFVFNAGTATWYVDGVPTLTRLSNLTSITFAPPGGAHLIIGRDSNGADNFWNGLIDEVRISNDAKSAAWELANYQTVFNATQAVQPVRQLPFYMLASYTGSTSCQGTGMQVATSLNATNWNSVLQTVESVMTVPILMQWNGFIWRVYTPTTSCSTAPGNFIIQKTPLPLTASSTFTTVATVTPSVGGAPDLVATSWFIGDDGIPDIVFFAGTASTEAIYLIAPTDTTGLTTWNTTPLAQLTTTGNYIDGQLIEISPSNFALIAKDETNIHIVYFSSTSKTGTYTLQNSNLLGSGGEGPSVIQTSPGNWMIFIDNAGSSLQYATTSSFPGGPWSALSGYVISGCENGPVGYCYHPHMFSILGYSGVK
jgi:Concanavalin A-like lectin/glucanases superfamily